jgi:ATP-dependent Clp endopeptidase proteolytic subunit ClpP
MKKGKFSFVNKVSATNASPERKTLKIEMLDVIGWYDSDSIWLGNVLRDNSDATDIEVWINSPGGSVFEGIAMYNMLRLAKQPVSVHIAGLAASIATIIAMAGDKVYMAKGSSFMIHNPSSGSWGESKDLRKTAEVLDQLKENLIDIYASETGLDRKEIATMMDDETWMTLEQAQKLGFIDGESSLATDATNFCAVDWKEVPFTAEFKFAPAALAEHFAKPTNGETPKDDPKNDPKNDPKENSTGAVGALTIEMLKKEYPEVYALAVADGIKTEKERIDAHNNWSGKANDETVLKNIVSGVAFDTAVMATYTTEFQMRITNEARIGNMKPENLATGDNGLQMQQAKTETPKNGANITRI